MALEITDANFEEVVLKSDKPVLVDFWAAWCGPCRMVGPVIEEISNEYSEKAVVGKVDIDSNQEYAAKYGVRNIPTVLVFHNGEICDIPCDILHLFRFLFRALNIQHSHCIPSRQALINHMFPDETFPSCYQS